MIAGQGETKRLRLGPVEPRVIAARVLDRRAGTGIVVVEKQRLDPRAGQVFVAAFVGGDLQQGERGLDPSHRQQTVRRAAR